MVFFGTPGIAVPTLKALIESDHDVAAVVTAPDRPSGRGMKLQPSEVKAHAAPAGIPVLQPPTLRSPEAQQALRDLAADVYVVVAYGLILPKAVLNIPSLGCINVHFSLLPRWRGAAPVQWAILEGDAASGVAIMQMDPGLDTGPVLEMVREPIGPDDTSGTLAGRLATLGARLIPNVVAGLDEMTPQAQPEEGVTYASKLTPQDARIDWSLPAEVIGNRIRAFNPRPGAWGELNGTRMKIWSAEPTDVSSMGAPGTLAENGGELLVATGSTMLRLVQVQPEGKARMSAAEFVRGHRPGARSRFV
ncbi:MAG: methionyl-tRNA formyltransferase [Actinomycetota bacterium]